MTSCARPPKKAKSIPADPASIDEASVAEVGIGSSVSAIILSMSHACRLVHVLVVLYTVQLQARVGSRSTLLQTLFADLRIQAAVDYTVQYIHDAHCCHMTIDPFVV